MIRQSLIAALAGAVVLGAAWAGAGAAGHPAAANRAGAAGRPAGAPVSLAPRATGVPLSAAALASAAGRCTAWASQSGFAENGYLAGSLTTAVAIALAESGCDTTACYDDTTHATCAKHVPARDTVDRGAWQLDSKNGDGTTIKCAFNGPCAARDAYRSISHDGTYFSRWATYLTNIYSRFVLAAQVAVNALRAGTVTSGLAGQCLSYPSDAAAAAAVLASCGSGAADQQWTVSGRTLRTSAGLCLAAGSRSQAGPVVLSTCDGGSLQRWVAHGDAALYNAGARRCLTDPDAATRPGAVIRASACSGGPGQSWFRP